VIGIDISPTACRVMAKRLGFPAQEGIPGNGSAVRELFGG
jgi:hypothetical protein